MANGFAGAATRYLQQPGGLQDYFRRYGHNRGAGALYGVLGEDFLPELDRARKGRAPIERAFLEQISTPGALFGAASTAAEGVASELFRPGGAVTSAIRSARGQSINQGFAPSAAEASERGIINTATGQVASAFAQQAGQLESTRVSALAQAYGLSQQQVLDLIESIYTGAAGAEQLGMARSASRGRFLGIF